MNVLTTMAKLLAALLVRRGCAGRRRAIYRRRINASQRPRIRKHTRGGGLMRQSSASASISSNFARRSS